MPTLTATRPRLVGDGPPTCSTSMELEVCPTVCHDVNRYYADLGVHWRATREQIKRAYLDHSTQDSRVTYIVKQLLNPVIRKAYDLTPLGSVFYDRYVDALVRRASALQFSGGLRLDQQAPDTPVMEVVDTAAPKAQSSPRITPWSYSFYLWDTDLEDLERLREWQELLVRTLGQDKEHLQLAVGLAGGMEQPAQVTVVGYRIVAFLSVDEGPTDSLAKRVASQLTQSTPQR